MISKVGVAFCSMDDDGIAVMTQCDLMPIFKKKAEGRIEPYCDFFLAVGAICRLRILVVNPHRSSPVIILVRSLDGVSGRIYMSSCAMSFITQQVGARGTSGGISPPLEIPTYG